jgi:hypothetical protein
MAKRQDVELENTVLKSSETFEINHAERILRMPNNGGWQLPEDSDFKFDFNDGIGKKSNRGASSEITEETNNTESGTTSK